MRLPHDSIENSVMTGLVNGLEVVVGKNMPVW